MTSQPGLRTIAIHILPIISKSKGSQTMKYGQLIEYNKRNIFLQKLSYLFLFFEKSQYEVKAQFRYILMALNMSYNKSKLYKTLELRDILNINFLQKDLGLVSQAHFVYDFLRKMFLMLHSINRPNFIVGLPLLLEMLSNMCITIVC